MLMLNGEQFTQGAQPYLYGPIATGENDNRIILEVVIEGFTTQAMLDTGAAFLVCAPSIANRFNLDPTTAIDRARLFIRGAYVTGALYRLNVTFPAEQGNELTVSATAFVPDPGIPWPGLPSIVGLEGCLERVRFAIDTSDDTFYFGAHP
jgi:hypothetical protein